MDDRITALEEQVAHLEKRVDELSDVVRAQTAEIDILTRRTRLLLEREADREADIGGTVPLADQKPPHW